MSEKNEYAMIIRHAKHGDLRNYICRFFPKLTWTDKAKILVELSKALNSLHQMNLLHRDFHCKNILVDDDDLKMEVSLKLIPTLSYLCYTLLIALYMVYILELQERYRAKLLEGYLQLLKYKFF